MDKKQKGFTLIELVIVIVILGILAVMIIPKYTDLKGEAARAATEGVAGGLAAAAAINYAVRSANSGNGVPITNCTETENALQGGFPTGYSYSITSQAITAGSTQECVLNGPEGKSATFISIGIA